MHGNDGISRPPVALDCEIDPTSKGTYDGGTLNLHITLQGQYQVVSSKCTVHSTSGSYIEGNGKLTVISTSHPDAPCLPRSTTIVCVLMFSHTFRSMRMRMDRSVFMSVMELPCHRNATLPSTVCTTPSCLVRDMKGGIWIDEGES
ncbi:hypothetical protein H257_05121 [Aphanomyces astaci]|uniref:Uncharacterized protein n=1 Tax=Aphanomyces astaci TaxID=112090 RepID=W4GUC5_APHAT|nr:hypothetical protein H257_05121 [Aphanomyces astaci]ETV82513.1 hypothetical protein H257_05121 [Aphanomyces astaci]|eukprot:XP_009828182.1 hypothetical protein H257_05121 [Aphanomyces astaci]